MALFGSEKICAVIAERTAKAARDRMRAAWKQTQLLELRIDYFARRRETLLFLRWLRAALPRRADIMCIATCRRRDAGGQFGGTVIEQLAILRLAVECGCRWVDIEIETAAVVRRGGLRQWLAPARWIISLHDFNRTFFRHTNKLRSAYRLMERQDADAIKIAIQASSLREAVNLMKFSRHNRGAIAIVMGDVAAPTRILALREGSPIAYAFAGRTTAAGQFSLDEMRKNYRAAEITGKTRIYGVIGNPIAHSLSHQLHNAGFRASGLDAVLLPFLVRDLDDFCACVASLRIAGFAVTLPHKESIFRHLNDCDTLAETIGAVNTVVVRAGKLLGYNTDYVGVLRALEWKVTLPGSRILILGAGGAARTAAFALSRAGAAVTVCARQPKQALMLARSVDGNALPRHALRHEWFDAIVNATPVGMMPHSSASPLRADELNCNLALDMVYRPLSTRFLQMAAERGILCISGAEMFLEQGIAQWEIWTGQLAPVMAMRKALRRALRGEGNLRRVSL